jgi:hypothetical protein
MSLERILIKQQKKQKQKEEEAEKKKEKNKTVTIGLLNYYRLPTAVT